MEDPAEGWESEVTIVRNGGFRMPVDVHVMFEDGDRVTERWDGQDDVTRFSYSRPVRVVQVVVDPEEKIVLDIERKNNSWLDRPDHRGSWKLTLRWLTWFQSVLEFFALMG